MEANRLPIPETAQRHWYWRSFRAGAQGKQIFSVKTRNGLPKRRHGRRKPFWAKGYTHICSMPLAVSEAPRLDVREIATKAEGGPSVRRTAPIDVSG